nr:hypothetical protein CFP56_50771 [Quercus suber]
MMTRNLKERLYFGRLFPKPNQGRDYHVGGVLFSLREIKECLSRSIDFLCEFLLIAAPCSRLSMRFQGK